MTGRYLKPMVALASLSVLALTGCAATSTPAVSEDSPAGGELTTMSVAILPGQSVAVLQLGDEQGYFEDEGLELDLQLANVGSSIVTGVMQGSYLVGNASPVAILTAASQGAPLKYVSASSVVHDGAPYTASVVTDDPSIKSFKDLAGKTVGINAVKGGLDVCLQAALKANGLSTDAASPLELPPPQTLAAIEQDQVDAGILFEPFGSAAVAAGLTKIGDACAEGQPDGTPFGIFFASEAATTERADDLDGFKRAWAKSVEYTNANPELLKEQSAKLSDGALKPEDMFMMRDASEASSEVLEELVDNMVEFGVIGSVESVEGFFE
ncbi:ABC transporter substrate-binding protein [Arthrobacter sulfonylureivorans]|uniref:ABC transporter substrate-binding protein n=1 Tax=Arthrobacter sulfonylureivorans TaxID=2486855 RepID=A0ABY3WF02_9MICC|nr:ABC transporter substrate-binding protein [Arthrobacter sulfonylureivorans]UNK47778.1 ABC transporter substrate-binding protein [Arthrobacter sulfonylureivorans]